MKKTFFWIGLLAMILTTAACIDLKPINGSGNVISQERETGAFDKLEVNGAFRVEIAQGEKPSLSIVADDNLQSYIKTGISGGKLTVETRKNLRSTGDIVVKVVCTSLKEIEISGAVNMLSVSRLSCDKLSLGASGACETDLELNSYELDADFSGSCKVVLRGTTNQAMLKSSGSAEIDASSLIAETMKIEMSGSGKASVNAISLLEIELSGSTSLEYTGNPDLRQQVSGSAVIKKNNQE